MLVLDDNDVREITVLLFDGATGEYRQLAHPAHHRPSEADRAEDTVTNPYG